MYRDLFHIPNMPVLAVPREGMPLGLLVETRRAELEHHLAEEVVRVVLPVIPHGDLERPFPQLRHPPDTLVDERLIPLRVVRVGQRFRAPLRLFAGSKRRRLINYNDRYLETRGNRMISTRGSG